jgi:hypothetical protein
MYKIPTIVVNNNIREAGDLWALICWYLFKELLET